MNNQWRHLRTEVRSPDQITVWIDVSNRSVNVLFEEVFDEVLELIKLAQQQPLPPTLVFRTAKPKGFIVGADLRQILAFETDAQIQAFLKHGQDTLNHLETYPGISIAVIDGACLGGGLEFALACKHRLVINRAETQIGMPEAKIGLMPGWGGTQRLIEIVGIHLGMQMLLDSIPLGAQQALEHGLADALSSLEKLEEAVQELVTASGANSLATLRAQTEPAAPSKQSEWKNWSLHHVTDRSPSQIAILKAVELGICNSRESGLAAERELFFALLSEPTTRQNLHKFASPKR